jgi:hypothetical protein
LGLRLKNTSGLHLMQGPITVFEGSSYAGDARILDLQPGEERLISYAIDLGTEVDVKPSADGGRLTAVKAVKGILHVTTKVREAKAYAVKNRNEQERVVLVEHAVRADFHLVDTPKPQETAADVYRFRLQVPAGKTETLTVTEEHALGSAVLLSNADDNQIRVFLQSPVVGDRVKAGLRRAQELRLALAKAQRDVQEQERQLKAITEDQARLRLNLREMPTTAKAYKRYLDKFDRQETQIEQLQQELQKSRQAEGDRKKELDDFLASFSAE